MIKITVEEIEILVTAKVDKEIKKIEPEIRKMVNKIKKELNTIKEQDITVAIDTKTIEPKIKKVKEKIKEAFDPNDTTGMKIQMNAFKEIDRNIKGVVKNAKNYKAELGTLGNTLEKVKFKDMAPNLKINSNNQDTKLNQMYNEWGQGKVSLAEIKKYKKEHQDISKEVNNTANKYGLWSNILARYYALLDHAKNKISQIRKTTIETGEGQKKWGTYLNTFKEKMSKVPGHLKGMGSSFKMLPNILIKANTKISQMTSGIKVGIGQVLKYAGALFSLRGIYNVLSSSAQSWLSSQNVQAKQLSANIEYMKYAMGSAFAPVIEYITNLVYKLMKAIQTVIYSLFKVNIFANASANSYANMADSAKKTAKETKTLSKIDEIDNIGGNDSDSSSSGGGTTPPNFDLSSVDSSLLDWYKNLDFYELGKTVASKINTALSNIDWTEIQSGAKTIAQNIGNFINGYVDGFDWDLLGSTVGNGINTALIFANTLFTTTNFEKIGSSIATFLNSSISTTNWKLLGTTIANGMNTAIDTAYGFVTTFEWEKFGISIGESINSLFKNIKWDKGSQALSEGIKGIANTISGFFKTFDWSIIVDGLVDFITNFDWSGVSNSLFNMLGSACANLVNLGMVIGNYIAKAFTNIGQYFQDKIEECGGNIFAGIQKGITDAMIGIGKWIFDNIWIPFINGFKNAFGIHSPSTKMAEMGVYIIAGLKEGLKNIWENVKPIFVNLYNGIRDKFNEIKQKVYSIVNFLKDGVKDKFNSMKDKVFTSVNNLRNGVKDKFNSVKDKINTIVTSIKNGVTGKFQIVKNKAVSIFNNMKTSISNIFSGIWNTIKKVINSILGGIESMANGVVKGINRVIGALNNLNFKIPDWVPGGYGGKSFGLNLRTMNEISIPKLATGNVATEETLAIFGEYSNARTNPEITAPQSIIYETTKQALIDSNFSNNKNDNNSMPKTIVIKFGSYRVAFELEELIRKARRQNGTATVTI